MKFVIDANGRLTRARNALVTAAIALISSLIASHAIAQPVPPDMPLARVGHSATLLQSGKVLIAGGLGANASSSFAVAATLLYDIATNSWTTAGSLATPRSFGYFATLLPNGKVLVGGGSGPLLMTLASAELFDPATSTWTPAASMATAREGATSTLLPNGRVLVIGGNAGFGNATTAEIYDPTSNAWTTIAGPATPRNGHTATLLASGRILVVGGAADGNKPTATAEIYDPQDNSWTPAASLATARSRHTATLLQDGSVLVVGGALGAPGAIADEAERYDPARNIWSAAGNLKRDNHTATLLASGEVLVIGGHAGNDVARYDPATNSWDMPTQLGSSLLKHTATALSNGLILVTGGVGGSLLYNPVASVALYDPVANKWYGPRLPRLMPLAITPSNLPEQRGNHTATLLQSGKVLIAGGNNETGRLASTPLYDPLSNTWTNGARLATARALHAATLLPNGKVLVFGGMSNIVLDSAEIFDPATGTWMNAASLATARYSHTATLLKDGRILVAGGNTDTGPAATAELYDVSSNSWTTVAGPSVGRYLHTATLLDSGQVLIAGGQLYDSPTASAEIFDPITNAWRAVSPLAGTRAGHTATLLADGNVLVAGGLTDGNAPRRNAERYDVPRDAWFDAGEGSFPNPRTGHTATLMNTGKVMLIGGHAGGKPTEGMVQYCGVTCWSAPEIWSTLRWAHTATKLPDGRVLIAGGYNPELGYMTRVALYDPVDNGWRARSTTFAGSNDDLTFGSAGTFLHPRKHTFTFPLFYTTYATRQIMALSSTGLLALGGATATNISVRSPYGVSATFKLTNAGALDADFRNSEGAQGGQSGPAPPRVTSARELADGSLLLAFESYGCGSSYDCSGGNPGPTYRVQKWDAKGGLDSTYGEAGSNTRISHLGNAAILSDGSVFSLGATYCSAGSLGSVTCPIEKRPFTFDVVFADTRGRSDAVLEQRFVQQMIRCSPSGTAQPNPAHVPLVETTVDDKILFAFGDCMLKLNRDATHDTSFGDGGLSQIDNAGLALTRLVVLNDGSTLAFSLLQDGSSYRAVKRLPNGLADRSFGNGGIIASVDLPFPPLVGRDFPAANNTNSRGFPMLDSKDRVLFALGEEVKGELVTYLARFDARMNIDTSFSADRTGVVEIGNCALGSFTPFSGAVDTYGRIAVAGQYDSDQLLLEKYAEMVVRLQGDSVVSNVVEFYNATLDHYFITSKRDEIAKLDAGTEIKGWQRTGSAFNAYLTSQSGTVPICRFYIPPGSGDSHFFGRDTAECNATRQKFPSFVLEDANFMHMLLPAAGICRSDTTPIYRVFSNRSDANHRYLTDKVLRDQMVEHGWIAEGDGPDHAVMCAPQ